MWPWGHLAVGYLAYSGLRRTRTTRPPTGTDVIALVVGTQFPDLVDKPLAWWVGVLPTGRSLAHSLLTASVLLAVTYGICRRNGHRSRWAAFAVGYVSHPFADVLLTVLAGGYGRATFLLWPILPLSSPASGPSVVGVPGDFPIELSLVVAAVYVWLADGAPGVASVLPLGSDPHRER
ncbi:membrane-bound metal-dependent hydrolase [Haladaptatus paucihalophilus DX253]|uniref:LexA-binding, inner membrane-associated putative hydrolase n=1 Tax=Haladaptatus paucihalophilus DX253 TaxID=797209 RepID=E7QVK9_HALPU|nr:metal-dependent hydrolase [Haladaptatus paucihalophilus]EFW91272.1 membrane-bound metal-dependent hydrolase [Haladaptatus paucihalophilus DX253]SHL09344.1 LexA-binding, inner membrane-associated putative hydrolase [Haladaptatus paucihalophilus DX253]